MGLIVAGEVQYRESALRRHQMMVERKAELEEEAHRRKEEEERRARERQIRAQKERVEQFLNEALALRQAADIRAYVEAVRAANASAGDPLPQEKIDVRATWALAEARARFAKRFQELLGCGPIEYITQLRMTSAMKLLRKSRMPMIQVAEQCGYESSAAFSKAFKKHTGMSPQQYRRDQRTKNMD